MVAACERHIPSTDGRRRLVHIPSKSARLSLTRSSLLGNYACCDNKQEYMSCVFQKRYRMSPRTGLSKCGKLANPARGPDSNLRIYQGLARAKVSSEFSKTSSIVTQFLDLILRTATAKCAAHFSTVIESTWIVLVLAFRVPITLTFFPMNFSGVFWSLSA